MREILFRAKRTETPFMGEWCLGDYYKSDDKTCDFISTGSGDYVIDRETLGQYTGV